MRSAAIAIVTFRRPHELARLLSVVCSISREITDPRSRVLVVDNDPDGSAKAVVEAASEQSGIEVGYVLEAAPGIAAARNAAVRECLDDDCLVFVDDDEVPDRQWLRCLMDTANRTGLDMVGGPVDFVLPRGTAEWVRQSRFFSSIAPRMVGDDVQWLATNNVLIRTSVFRDIGDLFSERYSVTGGSDSEFFMRAWKLGFKAGWSEDARVREYVPEHRTTFWWMVRRSFRVGVTRSRTEREVLGTASVLSRRAAIAGTRLLQGAALLLMGAVSLNPGTAARGTFRMAAGAGMFGGLIGVSYQEYKRRDH